MEAVLISIRPEWCELIVKGQKTVEVRKNKPKLETPFKCYIYCTLPPRGELFRHGCIVEYARELICLQSGEIVYGYGMQLACDPENRPYSRDNFLCQKVIGEFVCDDIVPIKVLDNGAIQDWNFHRLSDSCLSYEELADYIGNSKVGYGWHISDFYIYNKPLGVSDFMLKRPPQSWCYVEELCEEAE